MLVLIVASIVARFPVLFTLMVMVTGGRTTLGRTT
ncbi:hypothetical protein MSKU9_0656 [Komagataeibacter diospyri]|uniref:Uncharacterized protein n=1 Tax=Komagataeibacter diospyri TaxID=1932662 RepID=A0A4P5NSI6_9PROT|nr:hypothetical protein MSKU9_0656 [Komagataeibacter diospyri]